jgi:hypothetical protein
MTTQAPIKVSSETKERIRCLAAALGSTQASLIDQAIQEFAVRHSDVVQKGIDHARTVVSSGDSSALAAYLLGDPLEEIQRIAGATT